MTSLNAPIHSVRIWSALVVIIEILFGRLCGWLRSHKNWPSNGSGRNRENIVISLHRHTKSAREREREAESNAIQVSPYGSLLAFIRNQVLMAKVQCWKNACNSQYQWFPFRSEWPFPVHVEPILCAIIRRTSNVRPRWHWCTSSTFLAFVLIKLRLNHFRINLNGNVYHTIEYFM